MIEAHHICGLSSDQLFECLSPTPDCEPLKGRVVVPPLPRFPKCPAWHQAPGVFGLLALPLEAGGPPQGGQQARGSLEEGPRQTLFLLSLLSVSGILGEKVPDNLFCSYSLFISGTYVKDWDFLPVLLRCN